MLFLCNNSFDTQVEMIMNIQLYVPMLSKDKPKHCPFQFPPYRSGTRSLHELYIFDAVSGDPKHSYYV